MLEKCINHRFCWNKKPLQETLGLESNLNKRGGGGGGGGLGPKFHKADKTLFIFISFSIQKMCLSVISCPDFFSHASHLISRRYVKSKIQKM